MANVTNSNPILVDTAAAIWAKKPTSVRLIQWIDDAADLTDDDDLVLVINGVTVTAKIALTANTINNVCVWEIGPFSPGINVDDFTVTTIDHGVLLIWIN